MRNQIRDHNSLFMSGRTFSNATKPQAKTAEITFQPMLSMTVFSIRRYAHASDDKGIVTKKHAWCDIFDSISAVINHSAKTLVMGCVAGRPRPATPSTRLLKTYGLLSPRSLKGA